MKRTTLALTLCLGIALPLCANADPKDKEEKEARKEARKNAKIEEQIARRENREERRERRDQERTDASQAAQAQAPAAPVRTDVVERPRRDAQPQVDREGERQRRDWQPQVEQREPVREVRPEIAVQQQVAPEINREGFRRERRDWNRERRGPRAHSWSYDEARRYHRRERRDRSWWRSNYSRFALFGGGYYYWDRGYWYPAYGYDPSYSTYRYDEPIYGYNQMEPRQVMVRVQRELRRDGYYRGAIDGLIGPMTRAALARFQRDNGLYVTRRIDGPTLAALGVV